MVDTKMDEEKYKIAKRRVEEIKGFYGHLFVYIGVNVVLITINLVTNPFSIWFYWVTVFWGIGVFIIFIITLIYHLELTLII